MGGALLGQLQGLLREIHNGDLRDNVGEVHRVRADAAAAADFQNFLPARGRTAFGFRNGLAVEKNVNISHTLLPQR